MFSPKLSAKAIPRNLLLKRLNPYSPSLKHIYPHSIVSIPSLSKIHHRPLTCSSSLLFKTSSFQPKEDDKKNKPTPPKSSQNDKVHDSKDLDDTSKSKTEEASGETTQSPVKSDSDHGKPLKDSNSSSEKPSENDQNSDSPSKTSSNPVRDDSKSSQKDNQTTLSNRNPLDQLKHAVGVSNSSLHGKIEIPDEYNNLFVLPIARRPLFPGFYKAVVIKDPKVIVAIKQLLKKGEPFVGAFMLKDEKADVDFIQTVDQVYPTGVFAQITSVFPSTIQEEDSLTVVLYSHRRIELNELVDASKIPQSSIPDITQSNPIPEISEISENTTSPDKKEIKVPEKVQIGNKSIVNQVLSENNFLVGVVENLTTDLSNQKSQIVRAVTSEIVSVFKEISNLNPLFRDQIASFSMSQSAGNVFEEPARLADFSAAVSSGEPSELQDILSELEIEKRLEKALVLLKKEFLNAQLQDKISKDVEAKISKRQREFYLMEQLRGIKRELGLESDGKDKLIEQFKAKMVHLNMPPEIRKVFDEEIMKLAHLEPSASEFNVTRNYLDWLTQIPWGKYSVENYDIPITKKILDEDHYGLEDIKDRILEFVAVGKLRGVVQGKILCFVGPPGVGKTSIGKSISRALDRTFYRFSVGGLGDVAEIKGHRRTYVGAMPGKVIQALKKAGTENPLILIDEIDKLGKGHQGDPASALLELLDPEQNGSFLDHYMDVPINLSRVLFVCTANTTDTIPGPLLDRMEIIRLSGYLAEEKLQISKQYLIPQAMEACGLKGSNVNLSDRSIDVLIKNYCRESGVRSLKKQIEKIFRKAALNIVKQGVAVPFVIPQTLEKPLIQSEPASSSEDLDSSIPKDPNFLEGFFDQNNKSKPQQNLSESKDVHPMTIPDSFSMTINEEDLKTYIGPPLFTTDRLYPETIPGVVMGLAWTSLGGSSLYIESIVVYKNSASQGNDKSESHNFGNHGKLITTGQLGEVMKESTEIAYTYSISYMNQMRPENDFFRTSVIHLHVPEGATPKDGPSAGVTMATSLLSLALNQKTNPNVAMTGELTLTGKVLKIGGLREKVIAAKRSGITRVLFPIDNIPDWEDLPGHVKEGVEGCPINFYSEIPPLVGLKL
ncbi:Lon protease-like protein [Smittium mucronatum]|uniref:Lon protease homolog, mitochondrial n=1 Tax=Smittium mucronatum TaxID=133383 RepID=A0A1R0GQQ2_9FUNG|nr:Lon protease-like protein [Smittium mucronatum]